MSTTTFSAWRSLGDVRGAASLSVGASAAAIALGAAVAGMRGSPVPSGIEAVGVPTAATILIAVLALVAAAVGRRGLVRAAAAVVIASGAIAFGLHVASGFAGRTSFELAVAGLRIDVVSPAPLTALSFVFLGAALLALDHFLVEALVVVPAAASFIVIAGHLFGSPDLTSIGTAVPMTLWAAVAVMLLSLAILASAPGARFVSVLAAPTVAGLTARRLMPVVLFGPIAIAWLRLYGERRGLYGTELGVALFAVILTIGLVSVVLITTRQIAEVDRLRYSRELAVQEAEERFRTIFHQVPVSIWEEDWSDVITAIGELRASGVSDFRTYFDEHPEHVTELLRGVRVLSVNPETLTMFEAVDQAEMLASLETVFATPDTLPGFVEELIALAEGRQVFRTEMALRTVTGRLLTVLLTMTFPAAGESDRPVIVSLMDISARVQAEAELARKTTDLERSNQELEQFAYVASHDLQEPLRMVSSYTQLLAHRYGNKLDEDAKDFIGFAVDGANRMQNLINDLLLYSRVGTRGRPIAPVDSHFALGRAVANLRLLIHETGALVTNDELPAVLADDAQLAQLFQNLIGNGLKFRRPDVAPLIHVSAQRSGSEWIFSVRDNGIGIAPQFHSRIFVLFQRLHTRDEYPGTGIGLAICKRVVERHGGRIWLESQQGEGTTFFFTLPARPEEAPHR